MNNYPEDSDAIGHPSDHDTDYQPPGAASLGTAKKGRRPVLIAGAVLALVLLLGSAAFLAGQMLNRPTETAASGSGGMMLSVGKDGDQKQMTKLQFNPAKELPDGPPRAAGVFVRRDGNSIFVGTGRASFSAMKKSDGSVEGSASYDGPVVEIVVTHDTVVYEDATAVPSPGQNPSETVQQTVKLGMVDKIEKDFGVTAWGQKRGDRIVADVLLYRSPLGH